MKNTIKLAVVILVVAILATSTLVVAAKWYPDKYNNERPSPYGDIGFDTSQERPDEPVVLPVGPCEFDPDTPRPSPYGDYDFDTTQERQR